MSGRRLLKTPSLLRAMFGGDDHIRPMEQRPTAQPQQPGFPAPGVVPPPGGLDNNNIQGGSLGMPLVACWKSACTSCLSQAGLLLQMVFNIDGHGRFLRQNSELGDA